MRGYFLMQDGHLLRVPRTHIEAVIADPQRFGVTKAMIDEAYQRHRESQPAEQHARAEILIHLLKQSPIVRVREQAPSGWHMQLHTEHAEALQQLKTFADQALRGHGDGMTSPCWRNERVQVLDAVGHAVWSGTLGGLQELLAIPQALRGP